MEVDGRAVEARGVTHGLLEVALCADRLAAAGHAVGGGAVVQRWCGAGIGQDGVRGRVLGDELGAAGGRNIVHCSVCY